MARSDWSSVRLHVVTGKGGTGKTTVAAALAMALAHGGRRVLLMEVEGRQGIAQLFDTPPLPYEERRVAVAPGGGEVWALAVDPEEALLEYLEMFYNLRRAGGLLRRMGAIDFAITIAPGIRDVLLTGKACELVRRAEKGQPKAPDVVVLDAPPTGRITRFLNVNQEVAHLAKVGPIRTQADSVMRVLRSDRTAVHLVTLLEEMPVQETADGVAELEEAGLPVGGVIVNMMRPPALDDDELLAAAEGTFDRMEVASGVAALDLPGGVSTGRAATALIDSLLEEARDHAQRVAVERAERLRIAGMGRPVYELPAIPSGIDLAALYEMADLLREQGMA